MSLRQHFAAASPEARRWQGHFGKNTEFFQANIKKMGSILEVGSEQLRKWNINKKKKMTNSTKYIDC